MREVIVSAPYFMVANSFSYFINNLDRAVENLRYGRVWYIYGSQEVVDQMNRLVRDPCFLKLMGVDIDSE